MFQVHHQTQPYNSNIATMYLKLIDSWSKKSLIFAFIHLQLYLIVQNIKFLHHLTMAPFLHLVDFFTWKIFKSHICLTFCFYLNSPIEYIKVCGFYMKNIKEWIFLQGTVYIAEQKGEKRNDLCVCVFCFTPFSAFCEGPLSSSYPLNLCVAPPPS